MRTVDLARAGGCSVQQVRNLERDGVLPPAARTAAGYRVYDERHRWAVLAYQGLSRGAGPVQAKQLLRAVVSGEPEQALASLDGVHAALHRERQELARAREAVAVIVAEPVEDVRPSDAMSVAELAEALGVRPSTLRHWDAEGLVVPGRAGPRAARRYTPADVATARVVHQLRRAGYGVRAVAELLPALQGAGRGELGTVLTARDAALTGRSRALVEGAAALAELLRSNEKAADPR
ncbi:MerR family transcriptional regulator [Desertihabitans brevis]|uniref:MerR family transcriptional regulator n=1 Tax=Desertihabitans brevis TaxID=2268447 RepID=A0A367YUI6_9ACTN|nr:MerR family transcriptional regulator [Desertihabitans brevis]